MSAALLDSLMCVLSRHALTDRSGIIAVSGGPDSTALAHLSVQLLRQGKLAGVAVAHLNHQLRGEDSDADERFVLGLPAAWGAPEVRVISGRVDVGARAREAGDNLENVGRQTRYAWLAETARSLGAAWVATGHTADDQAETVLHHFLRGSGVAGLAGIPECRGLESAESGWTGEGNESAGLRRPLAEVVLVRPLLGVRRQTLLAYLDAEGIPFRRDASNDDRRFLRNRLRHEVLPLLVREFNPGLVEVLARTAAQMRDMHDEITRLAEALLARAELPSAGPTLVLERAALTDASRLVVREAFRLLWRREGWPMGEMNFEDWERLAALAAGRSVGGDFPGGVTARGVGRVLQLTAASGLA